MPGKCSGAQRSFRETCHSKQMGEERRRRVSVLMLPGCGVCQQRLTKDFSLFIYPGLGPGHESGKRPWQAPFLGGAQAK